MAIHVPLIVHDTTIDTYIFIDFPDSEAKVRALAPFLQRMPSEHVRRALVRYAIFIILDKPGRQRGGGTWRHSEVRSAFWGKRDITHVPNDDLERLVLTRGRGLIGIPRHRWELQLAELKFTVLHEAGHAVDYEMNLSPPSATELDFRGVTPACGGGNLVIRRVVEAYARYILAPARICREPAGEDVRACNRRVIELLRRSPAFRSVPASWRPGS